LEVTTLLIPGLNDDPGEVREMAKFIKNELGAETPWHISRFHPQYRELDRRPTQVQAIQDVRQMGLDEGLEYVYTGNVPWDPGEKTYCPGCSFLLIDRTGYTINNNQIQDGKCPKCGQEISGIEM
jgi:pyruvate formate lyase activating enzyme